MNPATGKKTSDVMTAKSERNQFFPQANGRSWKGKTRCKARLVWRQRGLQWRRYINTDRERGRELPAAQQKLRPWVCFCEALSATCRAFQTLHYVTFITNILLPSAHASAHGRPLPTAPALQQPGKTRARSAQIASLMDYYWDWN